MKEKINIDNVANLAHADKAYQKAYERMQRIISASLCVNCIHQEDCAYLAGTVCPIQQCETYSCGPSARPRLSLIQGGGCPMMDEIEKTAPTMGLCVNCENLATCNLPKPLSGVWHCEEYR